MSRASIPGAFAAVRQWCEHMVVGQAYYCIGEQNPAVEALWCCRGSRMIALSDQGVSWNLLRQVAPRALGEVTLVRLLNVGRSRKV